MLWTFLVTSCSYPGVRAGGQIVMSGVPASLDSSVSRLGSMYGYVGPLFSSYGVTQTSAAEYNCDCRGVPPKKLVYVNDAAYVLHVYTYIHVMYT